MLGMVVSTGVGGGLVLDGAPYDGRTGNAGHVGHVVVEPDGAPCTCGGRGCVETIASGPHMAQWAREHGWDAPAEADAKELADAANAGDPVAVRAFRRGAAAVAAMIASVGAVCDLDLVVVGGGVAKSGALLFDPLREALACMPDWTSCAACGWCPPSSAGTPASSAPPRCSTAITLDGTARACAECRRLAACRPADTTLARRRRSPFWLIRRRHATLDVFHRRPSVTEKSVEGPGLPGGPRRRTRQSVHQRAPTICVGAFVISRPF